MMMRHAVWLTAFLAAPVAAPVSAQAVPQAAVDSALKEMRAAVREIATGQEAFFAEHNEFAASVSALGAQVTRQLGPSVAVKILSAGKDGWAAEATHPRAPGKSCVYWLGAPTYGENTRTAEEHRAAKPGRALCDLDPAVKPR